MLEGFREETSPMFDRFTEQARKAIVLVKEETHHLNHDYLGTEHLLLGLLSESEVVAARALGSVNITLNEVREQVEDIVRYEERETDTSVDQGPFNPRSKKALESSLRSRCGSGTATSVQSISCLGSLMSRTAPPYAYSRTSESAPKKYAARLRDDRRPEDRGETTRSSSSRCGVRTTLAC
jgi:ATP-dependent Clp protease ATP-binding subunit ClpA